MTPLPAIFSLSACLVYAIILMNGEKDKGSNLRVDVTTFCFVWRVLLPVVRGNLIQ